MVEDGGGLGKGHLEIWVAEVLPAQGVHSDLWLAILMLDLAEYREEGLLATTWAACIEEVLICGEPIVIRDVFLQGTGGQSRDFVLRDDEAVRHVGWVKLSTRMIDSGDEDRIRVGTEAFW